MPAYHFNLNYEFTAPHLKVEFMKFILNRMEPIPTREQMELMAETFEKAWFIALRELRNSRALG